MSSRRLTICLAVYFLLLLLVPICTVTAQSYYRYMVQVNSDGSALWQISYYSSTDSPVDTWEGFQNKILNLLDATSNSTGRDITVDESSLQINTTIAAQSKITEYTFLLRNFSQIRGDELVFGDVFETPNFFGLLYGDAELQVSYPLGMMVVSSNPLPNERDDSARTLLWARTQDLTRPGTEIVLATLPSGGNAPSLEGVGLIIVGGTIVTVVVFVGFFAFKRKNNKPSNAVPQVAALFESEEDKIIKLLKANGGTMRQTAVTDKLGFSKAKTSQLLSALEKKGTITRYKNGRDKIVILVVTRVSEKYG